MLENQITAEERFTLVILANRVQIASGERDGNYYTSAPLDALPESRGRYADAVEVVCRLISGERLTSADVQLLMRLAHVVDRDITPGVVLSRPASGYDGRYVKLVTKLSMIAAAKRDAEEQGA